MKNPVIVLVNKPIKPTPAIIKKAAINLPTLVAGEISPYPTVVAVVIAHQSADGYGTFSTIEYIKELNTKMNILAVKRFKNPDE